MHNLKNYSLIILIYIFLSFPFNSQKNNDLKEAVQLLNKIRKNPSDYSSMVGINLKGIPSTKPLIWNDTLAKVAAKKAKEMAIKNYFNHVDQKGYGLNYYINKSGYSLPKEWLDKKSNNFFESICAGDKTPKEGIISLLNDEGIKKHTRAGHRVHLLSISEFYQSNVDIGIGWYSDPNSYYKTYMVVVIARHQW